MNGSAKKHGERAETHRLILYWMPVFFASALFFYSSSRSSLPVSLPEVPGNDKTLHVVAYLVWSLLCGHAAARTWPGLGAGGLVVIAAAAGSVYGLSDEFHQSFVPGRTPELGDLAANAVGSLLGAVMAVCLPLRRTRTKKTEASTPVLESTSRSEG